MKERKALRRLLLLVTAAVLLVSGLLPVFAGNGPQKTYEIAVVYDNSGSMYLLGENVPNTAWCHAKYAMEIFASMLDYSNGDKLTVFPMWEVATDGSRPAAENPVECTSPITIQSQKDIDKIHNMYTPLANGTPFTAVERAYNYIKSSSAKEKWLVVLTDGAFQPSATNGTPMQLSETQKKLQAMAGSGIKVQYLALGSQYALQSNEAKGFYAAAVSESGALQNELISICNKIFQRNELKDRLKGKALALDISMSKVIVFAQGQNAKITSLKDSNGTEIPVTMNSGQRKYSELSFGSAWVKGTAAVDTSLSGQVVTFGACPAGEYTLEYSDADKIQVFYEPDVRLEVELLNGDNQPEDFSDGEIPAGDYIYHARMVDAVTGKDVTEHELLGGNVQIDTTVTYEGQKPIAVENGGTVSFAPGEGIQVDITGTYLTDYKITNQDDPSIFPNSIKVPDPEAKLKISATVEQKNKWYLLSAHESWKPIRAELTMNGQPLTESQLEAAALTVQVIKGEETLPFRMEKLTGESAFNIWLGTDEGGNYLKPAAGSYTLELKASAPDEYGKEVQSKAEDVSFGIRNLPLWLWILIALIILAVIIFLLGFPVRPSRIYVTNDRDADDTDGPIKLKRGVEIACRKSPDESAVTGSAKLRFKWGKNSWIKNLLKAQSMTFLLSDVGFSDKVTNLRIDNERCKLQNGQIVGANSDKPYFVLYNGCAISWEEVHGRDRSLYRFSGKIYINKE
ncbi:MAG: VWA domain-containing protein [Clostridia bacterium]|nr:VWA domain-containing protein [Clostridia bacterium]